MIISMWKLAVNEVRPHFFYISHFTNQYLIILTRNPSLKHTTLQRRCCSRSNHLSHDRRAAANNSTKQRTSSWYFSLFPSPLSPLRSALSHKHLIGKWRGTIVPGHDPQGKILGILGMGGIGSVGPSQAFTNRNLVSLREIYLVDFVPRIPSKKIALPQFQFLLLLSFHSYSQPCV